LLKGNRLILFLNNRTLSLTFSFYSGYDALPVESMQGLELGSHHGGPTPSATSPTMGMGMGHSMGMPMQSSNYAPVDHMDFKTGSDLDFDPLNHMGQATPPQPPHDAQAAWYDTDL
jgi:PAB1-binding protein PBP1